MFEIMVWSGMVLLAIVGVMGMVRRYKELRHDAHGRDEW
jgi:hypothetical protein